MSLHGKQSCILFLTHVWNEGIEQEFLKIKSEKPEFVDIYILYDTTKGEPNKEEFDFDALKFTAYNLDSEKYTKKNSQHPGTIWPTNIELPLLWFYKNNQQYEFFWTIEYDVRYTGNWGHIIEEFSECKADLLATTIYRYSFRPGWKHWESLVGPKHIPMERRLRALFPLYRISKTALEIIDAAYKVGWGGHYEVTIPTIIESSGLEIEDIGGDGPFVKRVNRNRFYTNTPQNAGLAPGTFTVSENTIDQRFSRPMLWHPIKT